MARQVELPEDVYEGVDTQLDRTEFETVAEFTQFVLREVLGELEDDGGREDTVDEGEIKDRLRSLGYME